MGGGSRIRYGAADESRLRAEEPDRRGGSGGGGGGGGKSRAVAPAAGAGAGQSAAVPTIVAVAAQHAAAAAARGPPAELGASHSGRAGGLRAAGYITAGRRPLGS